MYNKIKKLFNRSKSYPGCQPNKVADKHKLDDIMEVRVCTASYCATCEEMVFQTLKVCEECGERKICYCCYDNNKTFCVKCYDKLMKLYDEIEQEFVCKNKKVRIEDAKTIEEYVDQLL